MSTALPPNGTYSTPPNGQYSSPKLPRESEKTPWPLKESQAQPLIKTLKVFLDANLSQAPSEAKKISRHVEQIPSIPDILKMIVERKEDIIREESPELIRDINALFEALTKLKESSHSSSLVNFELLDALYSIANPVGELNLSERDLTYKIHIITHCSELFTHYCKTNKWQNVDYFFKRQSELGKNLVKNGP